MKIEPFLPTGSIVLLKGGNKKLMIYGRKQRITSENDNTVYDYIGVPYPEGYVNPEYTYAFNKDHIEKVIFKGFNNEEEQELQKILADV